jgi:CbbQ/NirQ/NorQ C-terminal.
LFRRQLKQRGLDEGASTRMLIYAGTLIRDGMSALDSCQMTMTRALTDDPDMTRALQGFVEAQFG